MATRKLSYAADSQLTTTNLASLATSSTLVAGWESGTIDNSSNLYLDYLISGKITVGTTPTANTRIEIRVAAPINDTPTWPDTLDGTESTETMTAASIVRSGTRLGAIIEVDTNTSDRVYPFTQFSVAQLFGGICPQKFVLFVTHNTGVNLNATGSNQEISIQGVAETVA